MELTAEQFAEIVGHLSGVAGPDSSKDKRRAARIERRTRLTITPIAAAAPAGEPASACAPPAPPETMVVMVKNLSSRGMAVVGDRDMKSGSQFMLRLARRDDASAAPVELLCTVVHCEKVADSVYSIGAEFTCILGEALPVPADGRDEAKRIRNSILR